MALTLTGPAHSELIIRKSRFLGCVQPVADRSEAQQVVAQLWRSHPQARHVCWALMAGGQSAAVDDGEPGGTAGRPMLEVLRHQQLEGVLATVVRYFGGIKLGAGGLVRAYTDAVAQALLQAVKVPLVPGVTLLCAVDYAHEGLVRQLLLQGGASLLQASHGARVYLQLRLPATRQESLRQAVADATQGRAEWSGDDAGAGGCM